jgi:hypothetical protein
MKRIGVFLAASASVVLAVSGGVLAVGLVNAASSGRHQAVSSQAADLENTCTIDAQASYEGITLDRTIAVGKQASAAQTTALAAEPGSSVVEEQSGRARSNAWPIVDGHNVVVMRLDGAASVPIFGPPGTAGDVIMSKPSCVIAIYDADTGAKLVELQTLPLP